MGKNRPETCVRCRRILSPYGVKKFNGEITYQLQCPACLSVFWRFWKANKRWKLQIKAWEDDKRWEGMTCKT